MNRNALILLAALTLAGAHANAAREERVAAGFNAIAMGVNMELDVIQDGTESVVLEGDPEALAQVDVLVTNGTLDFMYKRESGWNHNHKRIHGVVHARDMNALAISASGKVQAAALKSDVLALSISGSGDIAIGRLSASKAQVSISGSGNIDVAGRADDLTARISGSGDIKAPRLESERVQVTIAGSGRATVWAKRELATRISGAGDLRYYGDPSVTKSVSGSGRVERVAANP